MRIILLTTLMVAVAIMQLAQTEVQAAAMDQIKDAAKSIGKAAAEKADSVTEVPQTGGVVQTVLHKTASVALGKGVDLLATKYPIVGVAAPHIKKFSKPMLNAAHNKINSMFDKTPDATTEDPKAAAAAGAAPAAGDGADKKVEAGADKPGLMDKIKSKLGVDDKKDETEQKDKEVSAESEGENGKENGDEKKGSKGNKKPKRKGGKKPKSKKAPAAAENDQEATAEEPAAEEKAAE